MGRKKNLNVWKCFKKLESKEVMCNFCQKKYKYGNVNKMGEHIKKCFKCPSEVRKSITKSSENVVEMCSSQSDSVSVSGSSVSVGISGYSKAGCSSADADVYSRSSSNAEHMRGSRSITRFMDFIQPSETKSLNESLAKAIFVSGASISMVEHPLWIDFFKKLRPSYNLPSRKSISSTYLDAEYKKIKLEVQNQVMEAKDLHLQCDGWSNIRNESIINFVISKPQPIFVEFLLTKENRHDAEYLAQQIENVFENYGGSQKFLVVIGDNAANMQAAFRLVKKRHPHIHPLGCIAHLLHLLCSDFLNCATMKEFTAFLSEIVKTIKNNHRLQALFVKIGSEKRINVSLKLPGKTRWGSYLFCLDSLITNKAVLQTLAVNEEANFASGSSIKCRLLDDGSFWVKVEKVAAILRPIVSWIIKLESNTALIHKVYSYLTQLEDSLRQLIPDSPLSETEAELFLNKIESRKNNAIGNIHLAACLLDPCSQGSPLKAEENIDAMQFIYEVAGNMELNKSDVMVDLAKYRAKEGIWGKSFIWASCESEQFNALTWWKSLCGITPLAEVSTRIMSAPVTSAATERSFSTFSAIHTIKRNRLTAERAGKITYLAHNWKLMNDDKQFEKNTTNVSSSTSKPTSVMSTSDADNDFTIDEQSIEEYSEEDEDSNYDRETFVSSIESDS